MMSNFYLKFFKYSPERFKNPFVISGLVIMLLGLVVMIVLPIFLRKKLEKDIERDRAGMDAKTSEEIQKNEKKYDDIDIKNGIISRSIALAIIIVGAIISIVGV